MDIDFPVMTIVVPCFNEAAVLPETARRLSAVLQRLIGEGRIGGQSHVLFVDDGSRDRTWPMIRDLRNGSPLFGGLKLSRNQGHQAALMAGMLAARGDLIVTIDAELQDDPEAIVAMLDEYDAGADIVCGVRSTRTAGRAAKRVSARLYDRALAALKVDLIRDHADFRLMTRRAVEALREYGETDLFLRALIPMLGFETHTVALEWGRRRAGESQYPTGHMPALTLSNITSLSTRPLRLITLLGLSMSAFAAALACWALAAALGLAAPAPAWASASISTYLIAGAQMIGLGMIGEYTGKIYMEARHRPRYHVEQVLPAQAALPGTTVQWPSLVTALDPS